uniref:Uncharacterized protein n=1 Tax=Arundo donax TaxID=35708 RepID=A0A0A9A7I7_ARUDO
MKVLILCIGGMHQATSSVPALPRSSLQSSPLA